MPSRVTEHVFDVFGAERFHGRRQVIGDCLLRHLPQRDDWQVLSALVEVHDELQVAALFAPDLHLGRGA